MDKSVVSINEPYILAYLLSYKFDPHPYVEHIVKYVQKKTGYKVVLLSVADTKMLFTSNAVRLQNVGPSEFVYLFKHASFVVTTSFHGTAFSVIYNKPFYTLVQPNSSDDRVTSLLKSLGLEKRLVYMETNVDNLSLEIENNLNISDRLRMARKSSIAFLQRTLAE